MAQKLPITLKPVFDLASMGVNPQFIKFDCTTMESDKFVCVREQAPDGQSGQISIFDTSMPHQPTKRPISAESAIMNPVAKVIALKNGTQMQIFNIELKSKMKAHNMPEPVVFWKWISPSIIAIISSAYLKSQKMKLDMAQANRASSASEAEMMSELQRLKDRVAVLERLATDGDRKLAGEIDRLRDDRRV